MWINRRQIIIYPFLFAIYPLLNLYVTNIRLLKFSALVEPLILILGVTFILYLAANQILKASTSAGILTTIVAVAILYYGAFYDVLSNVRTIGSIVQHHEYLLPVWVISSVLLSALAMRKRVASAQANAYLNFLSAVITGVILVPGVVSFVRGAASDLSHAQTIGSPIHTQENPTKGRSLNGRIELGVLPDVYYIILDGYGRADVLREYYDFDNSPFVNNLKSKGFYVAANGRSNYSLTALSLSSSLNMDYLDVSLTDGLSNNERISALFPLIENNYVIQEFNNRGYTTINFASGWEATDYNKLADINLKFSTINQFNSLLLDTTIIRPIAPEYSQNEERTIVLGIFDELKEIPKIKDPTFSFAHVLVPHPPFIFDREGNFPDFDTMGWLPKEGYNEQILFINQKVEELVDSILAQSKDPPIIIIQADHGPGSSWMRSRERMPIFSAYYLPGGGEGYLYPTITPVNTFRFIFDLYFGTHFGRIEDESFFSSYTASFNFCKVDDDDVYPGMSNQDLWVARVTQSLVEKGYRLWVNDCDFERILPINDGFYEVITPTKNDNYFVWAGPLLNLQFPTQPNQDYLFRAEVRNTFSENQEVRLLIDDEIVDSTTVPPGVHEIAFIVPAEYIHAESFVRVQIEHGYSISGIGGDPRKLSLRYHWIEWAPVSQAEALFTSSTTDIVVSDGIFLGSSGWYPLESDGQNFRWINNDAEIVVVAPAESQEISLKAAPGPGLSYRPFELEILDTKKRVVATAQVDGHRTVQIMLPIVGGETRKFWLHVEGGGQQATLNDPRTLNFRVFQIGWSDDVQQYSTPCSLTFSTGWHGIEQSGQDWWRWTDGQGQVRVFVEQDTDAALSGELFSIQRPNKVDILVNGERLSTLDITWDGFGGPAGSLPLHLKAGENIIEFVSHNPAITTPTDGRPLAIAVKNLNLTTSAGGGASCELYH